MDTQFYNFQEAKRIIDAKVIERSNDPNNNTILASVSQSPKWPSTVKISETGVPKAYRLVAYNCNEVEELVFRVQGVLVRKELPPVKKPMGRGTQPKYLYQSVAVAGLGDATFQQAIESLDVVEGMFGRYIGRENLLPHNIITAFHQHSAIEISNRYFTGARLAHRGHQAAIPFGRDVDPNGILKKLGGDAYIHTAENHVYYHALTKDAKGNQIIENISPSIFQVGDIVEVLLSLVAVKVNKQEGKYRMVGVLRCVNLLDGSVTEKANQLYNQSTRSSFIKTSNLKRYFEQPDSDVDEHQGKRANTGIEIDRDY